MGDVDGDGKIDIVSSAESGQFVTYSTGRTNFETPV